jgi:hypothetical protein
MGPGPQTARTGRQRSGETRPIDTPTRLLQVVLVAAVIESFVHYTDNTVRYDDYTADDPSLIGSLVTRWIIPLTWVLFTAAAVIGYRHFRRGNWPKAAAWIGAYSASGLISVFHYVDISPSDLSAFQNTFVFLDVFLGALVLTFALWVALAQHGVDEGPTRPNTGRDAENPQGDQGQRAGELATE